MKSFLKELKKDKALIIVIIISSVIMFFSIRSYFYNYKIKKISNNIEIDINKCKIVYENDTHGGFLGDGEYFTRIICSDKIDSEIKTKWTILPLDEEVTKVLNIETCDDSSCKNVFERYSISSIENGYYYFLDRHTESKDNKSLEQLNQRSSYNFSLGIYDSDKKIVYYYELDT